MLMINLPYSMVMYDTGSIDPVLPVRNCVDCGSNTLFQTAKFRTFFRQLDVKPVGGYSTGATAVSLRKSEVVSCMVNCETARLAELTSSGHYIICIIHFPEVFRITPMHNIMGMKVAPRSAVDGVPTFWS